MQALSNKSYTLIFIIVIVLSVGAILHLLAPILTPFVVAALIAYLVDPLVTRLTRFGISRLLAVVIVFLVLIIFVTLLMVLLIPLIETQITTLIDMIPEAIAWFHTTIFPWLQAHFGLQEITSVTTIKTTLADNWTKAGGIATWALKTIMHSGMTLAVWITNLILIPVVTFYLLRDWTEVVKGVCDMLPRSIEPTVVKLTRDCNEVLSAFFRGQFLVMLSLGIIYSIGLTLIGLHIGLMIGMMIGFVSIVPYLGLILGLAAAIIAVFIQFGTWQSILLVLLVFAIGQSMESMVLTPKLVGHRIGLHPVAVIFAVLAGAKLFGFFGVLLALPVAAVIMVIVRFCYQRYRCSPLYQ